MPEAFSAASAFYLDSDNGPRAYLIKVEGDEASSGQWIVNIDAAARGAPLVWVTDFGETPAELRPSSFACEVRCDPAALLTLLAGGPAELRADSVPQMQVPDGEGGAVGGLARAARRSFDGTHPSHVTSQDFLKSFKFDAASYVAFCERRHLVAYVPPGEPRDAPWAGRVTADAKRSVASLTSGASSKLSALSEVR